MNGLAARDNAAIGRPIVRKKRAIDVIYERNEAKQSVIVAAIEIQFRQISGFP